MSARRTGQTIGGAPAAAAGARPCGERPVPPFSMVLWPRHHIHRVRDSGYVERPERVKVLARSVAGLGVFQQLTVRHFGEDHVLAVHDAGMLRFMKAAARLSHSKGPVYPYVFPIRNKDRRPRDLDSCAGYYCIDTFTPLTSGAQLAARAAVDVVLTAAADILKGRPVAYALCRPPGHHAERSAFGGFCYLNNAAIAANYLARHGRVAVLDVDFHHGNGTQDIFYEREDVLTVSIHGHPSFAYPHFSGFAEEVGQGRGRGHNLNLPLPERADEAAYLRALGRALHAVERARPAFLVVSLGLDTMRRDQAGFFLLDRDSMRVIGGAIGALALPTLVVQEGGYHLANLARGAVSFFMGLSEALGTASGAERAGRKGNGR